MSLTVDIGSGLGDSDPAEDLGPRQSKSGLDYGPLMILTNDFWPKQSTYDLGPLVLSKDLLTYFPTCIFHFGDPSFN